MTGGDRGPAGSGVGAAQGASGPAGSGAGGAQGAPGSADSGGEVFGPYRLLELLGRGGMGEVWRAFDTRRERTIALKRLTSNWADMPAFQQRFRLEARATAQLVSEHVIVIHDFGEIDGRLFIDMRLISGGDLSGLLRVHPGGLALGHAVDLCAQIADGLEAAHRAGLIHRDVKPSNVLLAPDAGGQRAYLVDFGIAKLADELTGSGLTATGTTLGTPAYMAPELFDGSGAASPASDTYALACMFFEMLTGRRVFLGATTAELMHQQLYQPPPAPSTVRPDLAAFDPLFAHALAKNPTQRHAHPTTLAQHARDTAAAAGGQGFGGPPVTSVPGYPPAGSPQKPPPRRRTRRWVLAAVAAVVVIAVGVAVGVVVTHSSPQAPAAVHGPVVPGAPQRLAVALQRATGIAYSPDGQRGYVADATANLVVVIDVASGATVATIPMPGPEPLEITISPDGRRAYVTDEGDDSNPGHLVSVVDTTTNAVVANIPVGPEPISTAVSPDGRRAYVSSYGTPQAVGTVVSIIDTTTNTVTGTIPVDAGPDRLGLSPDGSKLYVPGYGRTGAGGNTVTVVDTATNATSTLPAGDNWPAITLPSPDGRRVYVVCNGVSGTPGSIQVFDTVTHTLTPLGVNPIDSPLSAALSPDGRTLVVPNYGVDKTPGTTVSVVDTSTGGTTRVTLPGRPFEAAVTPDGRTAWVTTNDPSGLWRIPLNPS